MTVRWKISKTIETDGGINLANYTRVRVDGESRDIFVRKDYLEEIGGRDELLKLIAPDVYEQEENNRLTELAYRDFS